METKVLQSSYSKCNKEDEDKRIKHICFRSGNKTTDEFLLRKLLILNLLGSKRAA